MLTVMLKGFLTGLLLQIAIGPVFFFIVNIALQRTLIDGWIAVGAVTLADYIFIALAVLGVGKLLEKQNIKTALGISSALVLVLFGIAMIWTGHQSGLPYSLHAPAEKNYISSFISAFGLTISSPLTIVFWTGLFAAKAIENGYARRELVFFGTGAGLATLVFLGTAVTLLASFRASLPGPLLKASNMAVGLLLLAYGILRLYRIVRQRKTRQDARD